MKRAPRSVDIPVLARELSLEVQALVGGPNRHVLFQVLFDRLGVEWKQLFAAAEYAKRHGWIEVVGGSVALLGGALPGTGRARYMSLRGL